MKAEILFLRHGEYNASTGALTDQGRQDVATVMNLLAQRKLAPDTILASNTTRGLESARTIIAGCPVGHPVTLAPCDAWGDNRKWNGMCETFAHVAEGDTCVMVVSHEQILEGFLACCQLQTDFGRTSTCYGVSVTHGGSWVDFSKELGLYMDWQTRPKNPIGTLYPINPT